MILHALGIPHTVTSKDYLCCAFTQKVLKFCDMMTKEGWHIIHYGHENSDVNCAEHVTVTNNEILEKAYGNYDWRKEFFKHHVNDYAHQTFNKNTVIELGKRLNTRDAILCFWGLGHKAIADVFGDKNYAIVEPGIGYPDVFAKYRVFESYAKMHFIYGKTGQNHPSWYDAVIPNYFDPNDFEFNPNKKDYHLYLGRIVDYKGVPIAIDVCKNLGIKLIIAGQGDIHKELKMETLPDNVEHVGSVNVEERKELLSNAACLWTPSYYNEPFGGVSVEAFMSGTPVISTDWGAFSENNLHGITGYRCRNMDHFYWAAKNINNIDPQKCYDWSKNFTMDKVGKMYTEYFNGLREVFKGAGHGFYSVNKNRSDLDWLNKDHPDTTKEKTKCEKETLTILEKWKIAQDEELKYWEGNYKSHSDGKMYPAEYFEKSKQDTYMKHVKLLDDYPDLSLDNKSILDLGGGPASPLLRCSKFIDSVVVDPCRYSDSIIDRYSEHNIDFINEPAETYKTKIVYDEVWMFNVLQHVYSVNDILSKIKYHGYKIRIFEWLEVPTDKLHINILNFDDFEKHNIVDQYCEVLNLPTGKAIAIVWERPC